jgi:hypothetical protein
VAPLRAITVATNPQTFTCPVRAGVEEVSATIQAVQDDADLLFDEEAAEDSDDLDEEDASGDPE